MDAFRLPERLAARLPGRLGELGARRLVSLVRLPGVRTPTAGPATLGPEARLGLAEAANIRATWARYGL